jgi:cell division protein FtsL
MRKRSKYEKVFLSLTIIFIVFTLLFKSIVGAYVQSNNAEIQRLKNKINSQNEYNLSMQMKINELASLDNALEVADAYGLSYNNSNIKVIGE